MNISILYAWSQEQSKHITKRNIPHEAIQYAENALLAGAVTGRIEKQLHIYYNCLLESKTLQNMKQKIVGLPKDEWKDASRLLKTYAEMGCTVKILHDEDIITTIFVQTKTQKELFSKFPEVVILDSTYRTNKFKMPLFTLMLVDYFGIGQPVGVVFMKDKTAANIQTALKIFASYNDVEKTKMVVTDKDFKELAAVEVVFKYARNRTRNGLKSLVWFPTGVLDPFMQKMTKTFTPFASKLIADQYHAPKGLYTSITGYEVLNSTLDRYISLVSVSIFPIDQKKFGNDEVAIEAIILLQNFVSHRQHIMLVNPIAREILLSEIEWRVYASYVSGCLFTDDAF
ncbi:hypothetical protein DAPPUDRAFT_318741 [Daphnia pulex]|uniref:ZSWIM1/3 RNaseH-like domain-containing protein n=1 Tax=Daphnia pulex TaxID=6669 RepID=E9GJL3_DAPPU|nr:hypothetical protein DAPPUDRAFT_318741 [Daphnia pulex]|eukprot:EFX80129.1 hypothetical protein DAPPUDRAFT_318741 [Daphnia pulex]